MLLCTLETDKIVGAGFFPGPKKGKQEAKGLALPVNVLKDIYYKNAARLYPRVRDVLEGMGHPFQ